MGAWLRAAGESAAAEEASGSWRERDRFFAEERQVMARTWGLAPEQTAEFEIVVTDFHQERQAVFDQITDEQITPEELGEGLREVDERATARLREVLGPERLLEYQLTAGHFVEAGLDQKPFVPPTPVAVADARPAGVEPPSAAVDTR